MEPELAEPLVTVFFPIVDHGRTWSEVDGYLAESKPTGRDAILADLARDAADAVDSARREQDPRLWLAASQRLMILIDKQPVRVDNSQRELFDEGPA